MLRNTAQRLFEAEAVVNGAEKSLSPGFKQTQVTGMIP